MSRVARAPVSVGRPSAHAPALRCTPQKFKGGVNWSVTFYGVFDVHRFYSSRVKFLLGTKIEPAATGVGVQVKVDSCGGQFHC